MKNIKINKLIIFSLCILTLFSIIPAASADTGEDPWINESLSCAGPYIGTINTLSPGTGGNDSYGINTGKQTRIRQNGDIKAVQFAVSNYDKITRWHVMIWRHDGTENTTNGTFTLVSKSENLASKILSNGTQNLTLDTPIHAHEGDYIGWESDAINNTTSYTLVSTSFVDTNITTDAVIHHGYGKVDGFSVGNTYDFVNLSNYHTLNKTYRINVFMDAVDTAFIGDSVISGRTNHTSYVDPALYWQPNSSMSYQWGLLTGRTYQNLGWRGQTTTEVKNRFVSDAVALHPQYVVIQGGLNDYTSSIPKETTLENMKWMTNTAISSGIHPIVIEISPSETYGEVEDFEDRDWINAQLNTSYENNNSVTLIHIRDYVGEESTLGPAGNLWKIKPEYDPGDHLHYNVLGYQEWARVLALPIVRYSSSVNPDGSVQFTDGSLNTNATSSYLWDFGDGETSTEQSPTHTYATLGDYNVSLTVTNAAGSGARTQTASTVILSDWDAIKEDNSGATNWILALGFVGVIVLIHFVGRLLQVLKGFDSENEDSPGLGSLQIDLVVLTGIMVLMGTLTYVFDNLRI